jgi:ribonuclease T1
MVNMRRKSNPLVWVVVAFAVFVTALWQQRAEEAPAPASSRVESQSPGVESKWSRVAEVVPAAERTQLLQTLSLIDRGGPYTSQKDGSTFSNREGRLPAQPRGYYREYTVPTPGAKNRGARRVVQGRGGETWYTRDHYKTFVRIDE